MSQKFNHGKVNMQARIASESVTCDRYPARTTFSHNGGDFRGLKTWLPIRFGEHERKTLPQIAFEEPSYIVWLYEHDVLLSKIYENADQFNIAHQLEVICNRMTKIRPPAGCNFAIVVDDAGVFRKFIVLKKGRLPKKPLKKGWKIKKRLDFLDIGIPSQFKNSKRGFERMSRCLIKEFFGDAGPDIDVGTFEKFVEDDTRFNFRGVETHKRLEPCTDDRAALEEAYKRLAILLSIKRNQKSRRWNAAG